MPNENGWSEYSKLVLKELDSLGEGIEYLKKELAEHKRDFIITKTHTARIDELYKWKARVDDVVSPAQLKELTIDIAELKNFRTKAVTIFAVIQFLMALALFFKDLIVT